MIFTFLELLLAFSRTPTSVCRNALSPLIRFVVDPLSSCAAVGKILTDTARRAVRLRQQSFIRSCFWRAVQVRGPRAIWGRRNDALASWPPSNFCAPMNFCAHILIFFVNFKLSCSIVQAIFKMLLCCGFLGNTTKWAQLLIFDFGAPGVPPKGRRKLKFMEPISIRVWYQVNTPGTTPQQFLCPLQKINSCFGTSQTAPGVDARVRGLCAVQRRRVVRPKSDWSTRSSRFVATRSWRGRWGRRAKLSTSSSVSRSSRLSPWSATRSVCRSFPSRAACLGLGYRYCLTLYISFLKVILAYVFILLCLVAVCQIELKSWLIDWLNNGLVRYDTIRDIILTCAQNLTWFSFISRTEPTTEMWKNSEN